MAAGVLLEFPGIEEKEQKLFRHAKRGRGFPRFENTKLEKSAKKKES